AAVPGRPAAPLVGGEEDGGAGHAQHGRGRVPGRPRGRAEPETRPRARGPRRPAGPPAGGERRARAGRGRPSGRPALEDLEEAPMTARDGDVGRAGLAAVAGLLVAWEIVGRLNVSMFVPPVTQIAVAWWHLIGNGTLGRAAQSSLASLAKGFVPAAVLGVLVG